MNRRSFLSSLSRRPLVVASLADPVKLLNDARAAARQGADVLEIRADAFPKIWLKPHALQGLLNRLRQAVPRPLILTLRSWEEGGRLPRTFREMDRLALIRAGLSEVAAVDVELGAQDIVRHVTLEAHKRGRSVILSHHDFRKTPPDARLRRLVQRARRLRGDVLKIAVQPRRAEDVRRFMDFCQKCAFRRRVFIAMGPLGKDTRREGFRWGSCLTYGYVRKPLAPGQLPVKQLAQTLGRSVQR